MLRKIVLSIVLLLGLGACANPCGGSASFGAIAGGLLGGLAGNTVGKGGGNLLATALGAVAGIVGGHEVGRQVDVARQPPGGCQPVAYVGERGYYNNPGAEAAYQRGVAQAARRRQQEIERRAYERGRAEGTLRWLW